MAIADTAKVILILGPTGSGKSSIIASATGQTEIVGDTMQSCTQTAQLFLLEGDNPKTYLMDTRGFSDSNVSDNKNVLELARSLCSRDLCTIQGVIYLHSTKETKFTGTAQANLNLLKAICGDDFWPHVIFATTMWDDLPSDVSLHENSEQRHLEMEWMYWNDMDSKGARVCKYTGAEKSVLDMVEILEKTEKVPPLLKLQKEALDLRILSETSVGKVVTLAS